MTKRITIKVDDGIDTAKNRLEEELGIEMSYVQFVNFLITFYRKHNPVKTTWRGQ